MGLCCCAFAVTSLSGGINPSFGSPNARGGFLDCMPRGQVEHVSDQLSPQPRHLQEVIRHDLTSSSSTGRCFLWCGWKNVPPCSSPSFARHRWSTNFRVG